MVGNLTFDLTTPPDPSTVFINAAATITLVPKIDAAVIRN